MGKESIDNFIKNYPKLQKKYYTKTGSIEEVVINLFYIYLTAKKEIDRFESAYLIASIRPEIKKKIKLWHLLDEKEFYNFVKMKTSKLEMQSAKMQERRHERRMDFSLTSDEWNKAVEAFDYKCAYCLNIGKLTYDHFIPFSKGGPFTKDNILPCCSNCNSRKKANDFNSWYKKQTFYCENQLRKINNYIQSVKEVVSI